MVVTRIKPEPGFELPAARLFLDDLEEVVRAFREASGYQAWEVKPEEQEPELSLAVKDVVCDSVEDLPKLGKKTTNLQINLRRRSGCELGLRIAPTGSLVWPIGITEEGKWLLHGKLQAIYQKRVVRWKDWLQRIPWWVFAGLFVTSYLWEKLFPHPATTHPPTLAEVILIITVLAVVASILYKAGFQHTEVVFRHSYEGRGIAETLKAWLPYVISAAVGGAVYALAERLIRATWP